MKNSRITKLAVSLLVVLPLFVSSVSACTCAHDSAQTENPCQPQTAHHSHESSAEHQKSESAEDFSDAISTDDCCCFQSAPRVFAKSEMIKIEKRTAAVLSSPAIEFQSNASLIKIASFDFVALVYLSDSFYNFKSPRAPPRS